MPAPDNLFVSAFRYHRLGFLMAVVLAIMIYMACLTMAGQILLVRTARSWSQDLENRMTVEIDLAHPDKDETEQRAKALEAVKALPGLDSAEIVSETSMRRLLQSWLDDQTLVDTLPLPLLIDIRMKPGAVAKADFLNESLSAAHLGTGRIHTYVARVGAVAAVVRSLNILAVFLLALTGIAITAVVAVTCRAALAAQHEIIDLLHTLGAERAVIAQAFQTHVKTWALQAGLAGFTAAALTLLGLGGALGVFNLSPDWAFYGTVVVAMACVPAGALVLSLLTARLAVLGLLRRLP